MSGPCGERNIWCPHSGSIGSAKTGFPIEKKGKAEATPDVTWTLQQTKAAGHA